ncbi:peptidase inhibitor family I36 protein [Streptomyces misionensis]|uniref:peptidase inhibitor family I36 protein n=1 Tax=Streptomyces misionensis TaxID=67331 RepID=UPI0036A94B15
MKKLLVTGAALVSAALITLGATGGPASATTVHGCASQYLCAYESANYSSSPGPVKDNNADLRSYPKFRYMQSIYNNGTSCTAYLWSQPNYQGIVHSLSRGQGYPNLTNIPEFSSTGVESNAWCNSRP